MTIEILGYLLGASYFLGAASAIGVFSLFLRRVYADEAIGSNPSCFFRLVALACLVAALMMIAQGLLLWNIQ